MTAVERKRYALDRAAENADASRKELNAALEDIVRRARALAARWERVQNDFGEEDIEAARKLGWEVANHGSDANVKFRSWRRDVEWLETISRDW